MSAKQIEIFWDIEAKNNLKEILIYIRKDSSEGARLVRDKIMDTIKLLPSNPEIFKTDSLKHNNDGSFRVFYAYSYRVVYKISGKSIYILRIRHTSREPLEY